MTSPLAAPETCASCPYARMRGVLVQLPGDVQVDLLTHVITSRFTRRRLHGAQARLLAALASGQVVGYSDLVTAIGSFCQHGTKSHSNLISTHVWRLRRELAHIAPHLRIECDRGAGYRLWADPFSPIAAPAEIASPTSRAVSSRSNSAAGASASAAAFSGGQRG